MIAILVAAVAGLSGWLVYELQAREATAPTAEVQAVIDDYAAAFNAYDGEAFLGLITSDYRFHNGLRGPERDAEATRAWMSEVLPDYDFTVTAIAPHQMVGDGSQVTVTAVEEYTSTSQGTTNGVSVFWLVRQGDAWKIRAHFVD